MAPASVPRPAFSELKRALYFRMTNPLQNRITIDPAICNGKPTIRGLRITVQTVLEYLGAGESREDILRQFPMLSRRTSTRVSLLQAA